MSGMHSDQTLHFLCDQNLGRLARWLRILGFDAEYMSRWEEKRYSDALQRGRIVLTRRRDLMETADVVHIPHDHVRDQIIFISGLFGLSKAVNPLSRCSICNAALVQAFRDEVKGKVPEYVFSTHETFAQCPSCGRIYWKGTHTSRVFAVIEHLQEG